MKNLFLLLFVLLILNNITAQNVGIGTTTPISKLQIRTNLSNYGFLHTDASDAVQVGTYITSSAGWLGTKTNHPLNFFTNNGGAQMTLLTNGNLGIGSSNPLNKLDVKGGMALGTNYGATFLAPTNGLIVEGSIGIGTNSPEYTLDVNGRARLRHNGLTSGLWFNKLNNEEAGFFGMYNDSIIGYFGTSWKGGFDLKNGKMGVGVLIPNMPISLSSTLGNKISLFGSSISSHYGLGINDNTLQLYVPTNTTYFSFGYGAAASNFTEGARLYGNGQFLIGTTSSTYRNHFKAASNKLLTLENSNVHTANTTNTLSLKTGNWYDALIKTTLTSDQTARLGFFTYASTNENDLLERMSITDNGSVLIGTTDEQSGVGYQLRVKGKIISEEVKVQLFANWPDYVFSKDYKLMSLYDLEKFINDNHHLPNIPKSSEVLHSGLELGEMQRRMMEKIEELTLHIIALNKKLEAQEAEIISLKQK